MEPSLGRVTSHAELQSMKRAHSLTRHSADSKPAPTHAPLPQTNPSSGGRGSPGPTYSAFQSQAELAKAKRGHTALLSGSEAALAEGGRRNPSRHPLGGNPETILEMRARGAGASNDLMRMVEEKGAPEAVHYSQKAFDFLKQHHCIPRGARDPRARGSPRRRSTGWDGLDVVTDMASLITGDVNRVIELSFDSPAYGKSRSAAGHPAPHQPRHKRHQPGCRRCSNGTPRKRGGSTGPASSDGGTVRTSSSFFTPRELRRTVQLVHSGALDPDKAAVAAGRCSRASNQAGESARSGSRATQRSSSAKAAVGRGGGGKQTQNLGTFEPGGMEEWLKQLDRKVGTSQPATKQRPGRSPGRGEGLKQAIKGSSGAPDITSAYSRPPWEEDDNFWRQGEEEEGRGRRGSREDPPRGTGRPGSQTKSREGKGANPHRTPPGRKNREVQQAVVLSTRRPPEASREGSVVEIPPEWTSGPSWGGTSSAANTHTSPNTPNPNDSSRMDLSAQEPSPISPGYWENSATLKDFASPEGLSSIPSEGPLRDFVDAMNAACGQSGGRTLTRETQAEQLAKLEAFQQQLDSMLQKDWGH